MQVCIQSHDKLKTLNTHNGRCLQPYNYTNIYKWKTKKNYKKVNYVLNSKTSQMKKKKKKLMSGKIRHGVF